MQRTRPVKFVFGLPATPIVRTLIWINVCAFLAILLVSTKEFSSGISYKLMIYQLLGVQPQRVLGDLALWQLVSYLFLHMGWMHLIFNMLALWWFGSDVERIMGPRKFLQYYFFTGAGAGLVSAILGMPTIGASGAIYGLLLAFGMLFPNRILYIYFIFPLKAKYCVVLFGAIEILFLLTSGEGSSVNYSAHLAGIGFGLLWFLFRLRKMDLMSFFKELEKNRRKKKFRVISNSPDDPSVKDPYNNRTLH
ncbi:MAG: rhomboid family intramembrane serine protease [Bdellovibrionales bacterium]|nr:rhomboid family intramembrane serine protease [Bdellovibrionales bacterium]